MPRPPRDDEPGILLHLHNRGIAKRPFCETPDDARFFQSRMAREHRRGRIVIHAYVIQANHFHILAGSPKGEISEAMRIIQNQYVRHFNRSRGRDGPLFRGRFGSRRIESEADWWTLLRYIDLHSVKSKITSHPGLYPFGSARNYLTGSGPLWLTMDDVEAHLTQGLRPYDPAMYERLMQRPLTAAEQELIELRMRGGRVGSDPLDDLLRSGPPGIHEWMIDNAARADGTKPGLAIASPGRLLEVVTQQRVESPAWSMKSGRRKHDLWTVLYSGLLREACALTYQGIALRTGVSVSTVQMRAKIHRELVREAPEYGLRSAAILAEVLEEYAWPGIQIPVKRS